MAAVAKTAPAPPCPNEANHAWHPTGYASHSNWADDAMLVANQSECPGCGGWDIWTPKRKDLRIALDWPPPSCDWGGCDAEGVAERYCCELGAWLPVCRAHTGVKERRPSPGRADCSACGKNLTLPVEGKLRAHDKPRGMVRCPGSGKDPGEVTP